MSSVKSNLEPVKLNWVHNTRRKLSINISS